MKWRSLAVLLAPALLGAGLPPRAFADAVAPSSLEFLGELSLLPGTMFEGEAVGGLSGLVWDEPSRSFLALSDDRGERAPPRHYRLRLDFEQIGRGPGRGVEIVERRRLGGVDGAGYAVGEIDPEGLALGPDGELYLATEGVARDGIAPFVARLDAGGREAYRFALPERLAPDRAGRRGVRDNLGFESLTVTPGGGTLVAGLENAVVADGPTADVGVASPARLFAWDLEAPGEPREYLYEVGLVSQTLPRPDAYRVNGLVDLLALGDHRLWALEREFVLGAGLRVRLYDVRLSPPLGEPLASRLGRAEKRLVADFADLGIPLDNFEGMTLGPALADGRRAFVVVSDDNFNPLLQATRFLVFAADAAPLSIAAMQGAGHRSPYENRWVLGLEGVVTAVDAGARVPHLFVESGAPDGDPATSEGLRVEWADARRLAVGDRVRMHGRLVERLPGARQLTVTTLVATAVERLARGVELAPPPLLG
ncbi:MAG: esterase-like activity of phytase family protein, partial [Thermoanaerobaculia bacterium]|nr:esterase-like activity of phytase family protein [Thermoanaerobaculia bacterium]